MSDPKAPTRKELAEFLPDQRTIKAFENIFKLIPSQLDSNTAENADSAAKLNQTSGEALQALTIAKSSRVLLWLSM
jgi:hypothetical protein